MSRAKRTWTLGCVAALSLLVLLAACGSGSSADPGGDSAGPGGDSGGGNGGGVDGLTPLDTGGSASDGGVGGDGAAGKDAFQYEDISVREGEIGWPCVANDDCLSGFCLDTSSGKVCTDTCIENCPRGWACRRSPFSVDITFICVPLYITLCDPCARNADCTGGYEGVDDRCIDGGDAGKFCGGDCSQTNACPDGYSCETIEGAVRQCVPESGACQCSPRATRLQLATECFVTNDAGRCKGTRQCQPLGISDCDAATPEAEICDGRDNDCSGVADDFQEQPTCEKANQHGACEGRLRCIEGQGLCEGPEPEPEVCDGNDNNCDGATDEGFIDSDGDHYKDCIDTDDDNDGIPDESDICPKVADPLQENFDGDLLGDACDDDDDNDGVNDDADCNDFDATVKPGVPEVCDFKDNDCDGQTDELICDDGEPCTDDFCDPVEGCHHVPNSAACDDGSVCTANDRCVDGRCTAGGPMNCDDGNPCTDDFCNQSTGCYSENHTRGCEDGNFCTDGDVCRNGTCTSGPIKNCNDDNPCTIDSCQANTGCIYNGSSLTGTPCDDGDPCQLGDSCGNGVCVPGPVKYCEQDLGCPGLYIGACLPVGPIVLCPGFCAAK